MFTPGITAQRRRASSGGGAFSPASLPGIVAWYDASNAASVTLSGALVTQWNSLVGSGYAVPSAPGSTNFTLSSAAVNGLDAMTASGNGAMDFNETLSLPNGGSYAFIVGGNSDASAGTVFLPGVNTSRYMLDVEGAGVMIAASTAGGTPTISGLSPSSSNGSINLFGISRDATNWAANFNDVSASGSGNDGIDLIGLCNYQAVAFRLHGTLCEVVIGSAALTPTQIAQLKSYLKVKWATP